ncbi:MAG: hypothetical protein ABIQ31_14455 [Ferruginibacter sp.]
MKKVILLITISILSTQVFAQKLKAKKATTATAPTQSTEMKVPMKAENWEYQPDKVQFVEYKGLPSIKFLRSSPTFLKNIIFKNGTIEFDVQAEMPSSITINFRQNDKDAECFYLRNLGSENPNAVDAFQYTPIIKGVNIWDLMPHFQGGASIKLNQWNHLKLVISGKRMLIYINDLQQPSMEIPQLESNSTEGKIVFEGHEAYLANLTIKPGEVEGLSPKETVDPTAADLRYLKNWEINTPVPLGEGQELFTAGLSKADSAWLPIVAERRGLINLTRHFGNTNNKPDYALERKVVLLRVKLNSKIAQKKLIRLGVSDEVWVFLNKKMVFVDKNLYPQKMRKAPDGRLSIENSAFDLALNAGENELIVGVAADFYGWGIVARLDDMNGVVVVK